MSVAETLVKHFDRMVRRDGGSVALVGVEGACITVRYKPGHAAECDSGVCIMPHVELQALMAEALAQRAPEMSIRVLLAQDAA